MKLKITTLVIVEEGQVQDIYHSLNAYEEIIDQVNAEYGDGGVLQFYSLQGIKDRTYPLTNYKEYQIPLQK